MKFIVGYEKAWAAFLGAGMAGAATTLAIWAMSLTGAVAAPDEAAIVAAITGIVAAVFAGVLAFIATTTPTPPEDAP